MIRMVFDPELEIYKPERRDALLNALAKGNFRVAVVEHQNQKTTFIVYTDMQAYDLITIHMSKAKNYAICSGCNSIHFKTEATCKDMFRCPCGTYVNKPKKSDL